MYSSKVQKEALVCEKDGCRRGRRAAASGGPAPYQQRRVSRFRGGHYPAIFIAITEG